MNKLILIALLLLFSSFSLMAQETGLATFYGVKFNNRRTASGEIYRKDSLVCAHRTHPFGTMLKVRNISNNKEVIVRVIDRGPFRKNRIIDLSYAAAKEIDMVSHGIAKVEVFPLIDSIVIIPFKLDLYIVNDSLK